MKTEEEVKKAYTEMLEAVSEQEQNGINIYTCTEGHKIKTTDKVAGTTPSYMGCIVEGCGKNASSSWYKDTDPEMKTTHEWYRPSLEEVLAMRETNPGMVEHILLGGLEIRPITK